MRLLSLLFVLFFTFGCTKEKAKEQLCSAGKSATIMLSAQIAKDLSCKKADLIAADLENKLYDAKICEKVEIQKTQVQIQSKSAIGDAICGPLVDGLIGGALTQIPKEWECSGGSLAADAKAKLVEACSKAL